jgi:hypothetical protein
MAKDFIMDSMKNILRLNPPAELVLAAMNTLKGLDVNF